MPVFRSEVPATGASGSSCATVAAPSAQGWPVGRTRLAGGAGLQGCHDNSWRSRATPLGFGPRSEFSRHGQPHGEAPRRCLTAVAWTGLAQEPVDHERSDGVTVLGHELRELSPVQPVRSLALVRWHPVDGTLADLYLAECPTVATDWNLDIDVANWNRSADIKRYLVIGHAQPYPTCRAGRRPRVQVRRRLRRPQYLRRQRRRSATRGVAK